MMKKLLIVLLVLAPFAAQGNSCKLEAAYADTLRQKLIVDGLRLVKSSQWSTYLAESRAKAKAKYEADVAKCEVPK